MSLGFTGPKKLNEVSKMPNPTGAFNGWETSLILAKTSQSFIEGERVLTTVKTSFRGVIQPMSAKVIALKQEGQRAFRWYTVHVKSSELNLDVDDKIEYQDKSFKIMEQWPWDLNGYREYHAIEDFE